MKKHLLRFLIAVFAFASLIEAVGASAKVPSDAKVLDGKGLTVYPGFFDTNSSLGIPKTPPSRPAAGRRTSPAVTSNSNFPPALRPEKNVAADLKAGESQFTSYRNAGITTVVTGKSSGIFNGHSAVINLAGDTVSEMIVKAPFAQNIAFKTERGRFPASLLGTFAAMRQMFNDARRLDEIKSKYAANPRGMKRPEADPALEALIPVVKGQIPVVIFADTEREIIRALDLTKEYGLNTILAGGIEAGRVAARLKAQNIPVLLTLDFPVRKVAKTKDSDPESLRVLRLRVEAPKTAAALKKAGIRFAFQSGNMKNIKDFVKNAGKTTENGLSKSEAVRAMTLSAAEILGVDAQLGSVETGKIANLVVTKGDVFGKDAAITHVFVDGKLFVQPKKKAAPKKPTGTGDMPKAAVKAGGVWDLTVEPPGQSIAVTLTLTQTGNALTGSVTSEMFGTAEIRSGMVTETGFDFDATVNVGGQSLDLSFSAVVTGDKVEGTVSTDQGPASFTGSRSPGN
jgi:imidazolonepropionase-like amidohydrolase